MKGGLKSTNNVKVVNSVASCVKKIVPSFMGRGGIGKSLWIYSEKDCER